MLDKFCVFTYRIYRKLIPIICGIALFSLVFSAFVLFPITLFMDLLELSLSAAIICDFVLVLVCLLIYILYHAICRGEELEKEDSKDD